LAHVVKFVKPVSSLLTFVPSKLERLSLSNIFRAV
jgi:hypothetical protein